MTPVRLSALVTVALAGCATGTPCETCTAAEPGTLYIVDRGGDAIVRFDAQTGAFRDVFAAGEAARIDRPSSVRLGPDGHIYLASFGQGEVIRYDALSTAMMGIFYGDTTQLEEPVELLFHGDNLLVLGNDTSNAVVLDRDGRLVTNFGAPDMRSAHDFAIGLGGELYVAVPSHPQLGTALQVWDIATGSLLRHFGTLSEITSATGIAFGDDGLLYVADHELDQILRFDPVSGAAVGVFADGLRDPVSLDFGSDGALYVVDAGGVQRLDPEDGKLLETFVAVADGQLQAPRSLTFVSDAAIAAARR